MRFDMTRAKQLAKWLALTAVGILLLVALAAGLGYGYLQSDGGRDWAARTIERLVSTPGEVEVRLGRLTGRIPFAVSVSDLRVSDAAGEWLVIEALGYQVEPAALLRSTLRFRLLEAERVRLDRLPEPTASTPEETASPGWPTLPFAVRIERLALDEVALGPAVLGAPAAFRVAGEATTPDGSQVDAAVSLERSDGQAGNARAAVRYVIAERYLDVDAQVEEPAGGLIVRALGLDALPALAARATGRGPLSDWTGTLSVTLENLAQAQAELKLQAAEDTAFSLAGGLDTLADFRELPWRLLEGHVDIAAEGRWQEPETLVLERGRIASSVVDLSLAGTFDMDGETLEAEASLRIPGALELQPYLPDAALTGLDATATARGAFAAPTISTDLQAKRVTLPDVTAGDVAVTIEFEPAADFDPDRLRGRVTTSGTAGRMDLTGLTDWSPAIGQSLAWKLDAEVDGDAGALRAVALSLETERGRLTGDGAFAWQSGGGEARLRLAYPDLAPVAPLLGIALDGSLQATAEVTSAGPLGALDAEVSGTLADLAWPDPVAEALAAPNLKFRATVGLEESGALSLTGVHLTSPTVRVAGDVNLAPGLSEVSAGYRVEIADLAVLGPAVGQPLSGSAVVTGRAEGNVEALDLTGDLEIPSGTIAAVPVEAVSVAFTAAQVPARPSGRVQAKLGSPVGEVAVETDYRLGEEALDLTALSLAVAGLQAAGQAQIPLSGAPVTLGLDGRAESVSPWLALTGLEGDGGGSFRLDLSPDGSRQAGRLETRLADVRLALAPQENLTAGELTASLASADLLASAGGKARLAVRDLAVSDLKLASLDIEASGGPAGGDVRATAAGDWHGALSLDAAGRVAVDGKRVEVEVSHLAGRALAEDLALERPLRAVVDRASIEISDLDLAYGEARLQATARRAPDGLSADITLADLPLAALHPAIELPFVGGRGDARLRLSGTTAAPLGELAVDLSQVRLAELPEVPAFDVDLQGRWRDGVIAATGRLTGLTDEEVALSFDVPLRLDPVTLVPAVPPDGPLAGKLDWQGPIAPLWALVPTGLHELSGQAEVRATLAGSVGTPKFGGDFALRQGRYESLEAGTLLRDLELSGVLADTRIEITRLSAGDGGSGSLSASGVIALEPGQGFNGELAAKFETFALLRRDEITAVGQGDIRVTGSPERSLVAGRIVTDSVEVHIPDRLPPDVVDLVVVEEGVEEGAAPAKPGGPEDGAAAARRHRTTFDLAIEIPRRAFIRGRGIDSEWTGRLTLSGSGDQVAIKGTLRLVRGRVAALGKTFVLDEGRVSFLGTAANDPDLNIVARRETDDLDVTITVAGPLSNPKLAFISAPELPEDEIISQVLFGKSTSQLSAVEAAQLAASVAQMTGQAGGADGLLGRVRASLGIDVLRLDSDETGDSSSPSVAAGKYITEDVYIGAKQGAETDSGAAEVGVELTPNISVESEVGQEGQSELGVKFKWDY